MEIFSRHHWHGAGFWLVAAGVALMSAAPRAQAQTPRTRQSASANADLAQRILETMLRVPGNQAGYRTVHAKGLVCQGTFTPSPDAASLSKAAHFQQVTPVVVRFSDGAPDPLIPDASANAGPRGLAIRFTLPDASVTDVVAMSHNGFVVANGEEFLALQTAIVSTDPTRPHPWPVETFLGSHPLAAKFVQDNQRVPASFATEAFFSNDAFVFVNAAGTRQVGRYQIRPVAGERDLTDAEASGKPSNFLIDDLKTRLAAGPVEFRLVVQIPNPGDATDDPSAVWPHDRRTIEVGPLTITSVVADSAAAEKALAFDPVRLTGGIELSDDGLPALRSLVYALAAAHRR